MMVAETIQTQILHRITSFYFVENYTLRLRFDDGTERVVDLEPLLSGGLFGPLRDLTLFKQVELDPDFGALFWPNGADIDPMVLYDWPDHIKAILERRQATQNAG